MIVIKLHGGLGNQMFQYALGRNLSDLLKTDLYLDITYYNKERLRKYSLASFQIQAKMAGNDQLAHFTSPLEKFLELFRNDKKIITEQTYAFDPEILKLSGNRYLDGYWQSEKYFSRISEILKKEFQPKKEMSPYYMEMAEKIRKTESVSVHVRRGDYVTNDKVAKAIGALPLDYYTQSFEEISKKVTNPNFYVFSDKIEEIKGLIITPGPAEFVSRPEVKDSDFEDLLLMSKCKHHITANSSFSWWAAWLCENKEKIVIAPENWFKDKTRDSSDLLPSTWIKIR
jgi:hypothetical protein